MQIIKYLFIFSLLCSCSIKNTPVEVIENEIVMHSGMSITATNKIGKLTVTAGKGFERNYTWEGETRSVVMIPRKKRWYGRFGIYFPGTGNHWKTHNQITRGVLEEAVIDFDTIENAMAFIQHPSRKSTTVYRDDGLVVTWIKNIKPSGGPGSTLHVDVWQVLIKGEKPIELPQSDNSSIQIE